VARRERRRFAGLIKRDYYLACQNAGRVLLLVHRPDHVACLRNRGLELGAAITGGLKDGGEITELPMLKHDGEPSVGTQKTQTRPDAAGQAVLIVGLGIGTFPADDGFLVVGLF
jgi:hypothetical protein